MTEKLKLGASFLLVIAGVAAFYVLDAYPLVVRILALMAGMGLAIAVAWTTPTGRSVIQFGRESVQETKKVVWPTRKESIQTTAVVFALVVVMAIFLWFVDVSVFALVKMLLGRGD
jgi:preprotein translocase subunit SecE